MGLTILQRNKADGNAENFATLDKAITTSENGETIRKVGILAKEREINIESGGMLAAWEQHMDE